MEEGKKSKVKKQWENILSVYVCLYVCVCVCVCVNIYNCCLLG